MVNADVSVIHIFGKIQIMKIHRNSMYYFLLLSLAVISCNQIETKTESILTDEVKGQLLNKNVCDDVRITDLNFDNSPADNSGTNFNLSGVATLTGGVERAISLEGDLTKNDNWSYSFGEETQESMTRRMLQLLNSGTFSSLGSDNSIPSDISFESDNSGYYHSQDGDRYSFDYSISNVYHKNEFPTIRSTGSKCDELVESITLDRQYFAADFTMSNNRFVLKGTIRMNGPDMRVDISADVEDNETSKSDHLEWTLYKE